jgi:hypothetical protein
MTRVRLVGRAFVVLVATAVFAPACGSNVAGAGDVPGDRCGMPGILECGTSSDGKQMGVVLSCPLMAGAGYGSWQMVFQCPPEQPCNEEVGSTSVTCGPAGNPQNDAYAIAGTSCAVDGNAACAFDGSAVLNCLIGMWTVMQSCGTGANACHSVGPGASSPNWSCPASSTGCVVCGS